MPILRIIKSETNINFMRIKKLTLFISSILFFLSLSLVFIKGLNLGIDFTGGSLIEVRFKENIDLNNLRMKMNKLDLGEIQLQTIGNGNDIVIKVQDKKNNENTQSETIQIIKNSLSGESVEYRRAEFVGPKVGGELVNAGIIAVIFSLIGILIYIWIRFQWNFAIGAIIALVHDVILTLGFFSVLQLEFNLATVAAVLTIAGYSINDTVVIYDRIRDTMRKYKQITFDKVINISLNGTLSRTLTTSLTTLLALIALYTFGGIVISSFIIALIWGVLIGTYSSVYVASPILTYLKQDNR
jgi:preprotein translocase SecF subunit|tara:strand:- start:732 stop:1628 length:897 start_codon:yes stop_codon:yes gene_type:complete